MTDSANMPENPGLAFEKSFWKKGIRLVAGIDEAGRGAWAGPVTAAAVILPCDPQILKKLFGVRDSKQMTPRQREYWQQFIKEMAIDWAIGWGSVAEIDGRGILNATRLAMTRAVQQLSTQPQHLLIDAVKLPEFDIPQSNLIKGDMHVLSIAAASVLAKTARDRKMVYLDRDFPGYGFSCHKGYGTKEHQSALALCGVCKQHRLSYRPVKAIAEFSTAGQGPLHG
jgi:ribonuclease HII